MHRYHPRDDGASRERSASNHEGESRGLLALARVIEVIAGERRAPILQHAFQPPIGERGRDKVFRQEGQSEAADGGVNDKSRLIEDELAFHPHVERPAILLEFPDIESA
jgi:hypothetical protein